MTFNGKNGCAPKGGLVAKGTTLYGTTTCGGRFGNGNLFSVTTGGKFRVLRDFSKEEQGTNSTLLRVGPLLYGVASTGGHQGNGTIYSIDLKGKVKWINHFSQPVEPYASLTEFRGLLYGTTVNGGGSGYCPSTGCGTVFQITPSGKRRTFYRFEGYVDGAHPYGRLVVFRNALYGTTAYGTLYNEGTIYVVTAEGEHALSGFGMNAGSWPSGTLALVNNVLYGTTQGAGKHGGGTVFSSSPPDSTLYDFGSQQDDGSQPQGGLIYADGAFYGTTAAGGSGCGSIGCGTIFKITQMSGVGVEQVLYRFTGGADGAHPISELTDINGVLYGTTPSGGDSHGYGTVFALTP